MRTLRPMRCFVGPHGFVYILRHASRLGKTPHFGGCAPRRGRDYDPQIRTRPKFLYNAPTPGVLSSYVYSSGSYRVDKHTHKPPHKQILLKTSNVVATLRRWVIKLIIIWICPSLLRSVRDSVIIYRSIAINS